MSLTKNPYFIAIACSFLLFSSACSHSPRGVAEIPETANAAEEIHKLDMSVKNAGAEHAGVLSPKSFYQAEQAVEDAKSKLRDGDDKKDVLKRIAQGQAYLNETKQNMQTMHDRFSDVLTARQQAMNAGALQFYNNEFQDAEKDLRDISEKVEKGLLRLAELNRAKLETRYKEIELKTIDKVSLGRARELLEIAKSEDARRYAPKSLDAAEKSIADAEAFIVANRHEGDEIRRRSLTALQTTDFLLRITRESRSTGKTTSEEVAIRLDRDSRNLADAKEKAESLSNKTRALMGTTELDKSMERARQEFSAEEAEVYRQGNSLTIRLKGLEFPVNQAVLRGSDYSLLGKVQDVLKAFDNPKVKVEGHTDSVGEKNVNKKLSIARANAVKNYLVSKQAVQPERITVAGADYQRPLASNKSSDGRAQNRRVDIIISM